MSTELPSHRGAPQVWVMVEINPETGKISRPCRDTYISEEKCLEAMQEVIAYAREKGQKASRNNEFRTIQIEYRHYL